MTVRPRIRPLGLMIAVVFVLSAAVASAGEVRALKSRGTVRTAGTPWIVAGGNHTCVLGGDGFVQCWGQNGVGQLGDGTTVDRTFPRQSVGPVVQVVAGFRHTCALAGTGVVVCWGFNNHGQIGDGTTTNRLTARQVLGGLTDAVAVAAGQFHTCALRAGGTVVCWGDNVFGQLGDGTRIDRLTPAPVSSLTGVVALALSGSSSCALLVDGTAACWGANSSGQLGDSTTTDRLTPVSVTGLTGVAALASGSMASGACALVAGGEVRCWGSNLFGSLGDGTSTRRTTPVPIVGLANDTVAVSLGQFHGCAIRSNGSASCWGFNPQGQVGDGSTTSRSAPVAVTALTDAVAMAAGVGHTCALKVDGTVRCGGDNAFGQLGDGSTLDSTVLIAASFINGPISGAYLEAGGGHKCAARADGTVACWGLSQFGAVGDGTTNTRGTPVAVTGLDGVMAVEAGASHSCALRADGTVRCWGQNSSGELGNGTTTNRLTPVSVTGLTGAIALAAGGTFTCALRVGGQVDCWGSGSRLADGINLSRSVPGPVSGLTDAVAVAAGSGHVCAVRVTGSMVCWGDRFSGQLGNGTTTGPSPLTPVPVFGITNAVAVTGGLGHTCALRADGLVRCWGDNSRGQLGNNSITPSSVPVPVANLAAGVAIAAGNFHSCAGVAAGRAHCWGDNDFGQLGDTTTTDRLTPVPVANLNAFSSIVAGGNHSGALVLNGAPFSWGINSNGAAGDGTFVNRTSAVEVPSFRFNVDPDVTLAAHGRIAIVTALVNCPADAHAYVTVELTRGTVTGIGRTVAHCTGALDRVPVRVHARGRTGFDAGPGEAVAGAVVRHRGHDLETQEWSRAVDLAF